MNAISYRDGGLVVVPDDCPDCGESLYDSGCDAPGCPARGCQACGWGCDLDFLDEDQSRCAQAIAAEDPETRSGRIDAERAAFGLDSLSSRDVGDEPGVAPR